MNNISILRTLLDEHKASIGTDQYTATKQRLEMATLIALPLLLDVAESADRVTCHAAKVNCGVSRLSVCLAELSIVKLESRSR